MGGTWIFEDIDSSADYLPVFLLQVFITLVLTRFLGRVLARFRQPPVIGEIIGGILLGPSLFGLIPNFTNVVFPSFSTPPFVIVGNIGLIMFMFIMGVEVEPRLLQRLWKVSVPIAFSAIIIPFGVGALLSLWLYDVNNWDPAPNWVEPSQTAFILFTGTAFSFTAFPVLASILSATKLLNSPLGIQTIAAAAVDDVMAWSILSVATAFSATGSGINGFYVFLCAMIFLAVMLVVVRPIIHWVHARQVQKNDEFDREFVLLMFLLIVTCSFTTEVIGIHAFFGAFVCGICMPKDNGSFTKAIIPKLDMLVTELLLPLYFANSGIRTDITKISSGELFAITLLIIFLAILVKFVPSMVAARYITKRDWRFCAALGILMNTRGLVALIALNVGLSNGIFSVRLFTMFVLMAIVTTLITSPVLWVMYQRRYEEEEAKKAKEQMEMIKKHASNADVLNEEPGEEPVLLFHPDDSEEANTAAPEGTPRPARVERQKSVRSGMSVRKNTLTETMNGIPSPNKINGHTPVISTENVAATAAAGNADGTKFSPTAKPMLHGEVVTALTSPVYAATTTLPPIAAPTLMENIDFPSRSLLFVNIHSGDGLVHEEETDEKAVEQV